MGRILLRRLDDLHDVLRPDVRELVDGRLHNPNFRSNRRSLLPYTEAEWSRLVETCRSMIRTSFVGYRDARAMAERAADPRTSGWSADSAQWLLSHRGPDSGRVLSMLLAAHRRATSAGASLHLVSRPAFLDRLLHRTNTHVHPTSTRAARTDQAG
ncbi:hypothetical protein [Streptoalloteichus hindustanus]|uniref:hypothetical protein n=1 Tax=Streptoalloteichus hindustanus TaxID=2017 RepID=UPI0011613872|nr:hypothetical protein [Streptoalloteichus hindustanus]